MIFSKKLLPLFVACFSTVLVAAQEQRFTSCAAIFLDEKMIVDDYSPTGVCRLPAGARGTLSVHTVDLGPGGARRVDPLRFRVALRDGQTRTLYSFSEKTYRTLDLAPVLARAKAGDSIVVLTTDDHFALPHSEILIE